MQINIREIMDLIPHRYPFLLIDRVTDVAEDKKSLTAVKCVTMNEPHFTGHFPGVPVMPGVLIVESMAQACGVLVMVGLTPEQRHDGSLFYFAAIDDVRFKRPVEPGDQMVIKAELLRIRGNICWCQARAYVGDELACTAKITCSRRPPVEGK
ncbi:MAG: 3-hydroxyacyl-ACP dehydratase FabZ [Duodenibacillus sp.]|nr:3-hydroxyacyl-ACP dehydratase FabZ [Duodenibacillus sp.]